MKMARIIVGLLMILFISGNTTADMKSEITPELVEMLIGWDTKIYETIKSYKNPDESRENIRMIMKVVQQISDRMDALDHQLGVNLRTMLKTFISGINTKRNPHQFNRRLRRYFSKIDNYFDASRTYKFGGVFVNETLSSFAHKALWNNGSVADNLDGIYKTLFHNDTSDSNFLSVIHEHALLNVGQICDTNVSVQQQVYYIYTHLVITEIKGLLTQQHCFNIKHLFDDISLNYIDELNRVRALFEERVKKYYELFSNLISRIPQNVRRCEARSPERGVHFLELQNFARLKFLNSQVIIEDGCNECPGPSKLRDESLRTSTTIINCEAMGTHVLTCPSELNSHRQYSWWKDVEGSHYGLNTSCENRELTIHNTIPVSAVKYPFRTTVKCQTCVCSTYLNQTQVNDNSTIWRISVTNQISEIMNNKVVTGIRFVTRYNALHLQIKQAQFSHSGIVYNNSGWKDLDIGYHYGGSNEVYRMKYKPLRYDRRSIYLDDIKLPEGYVVTGVRFKLVDNSAFKFQILATQYDFRTGKLNPYVNVWHDASTYPMRPRDYERKRIEIHMDKPDDPTKASGFEHDIESNKLIKFTHTDIYKDGGQTTIPLLDAQPVVTKPSFPLSGIGLSFRERESFGGYIALHVHTFDVSKHVEMHKVHPVMIESSSTTEEVQHEFPTMSSSTVGNDKNNVKSKKLCRFCGMDIAPHVVQV